MSFGFGAFCSKAIDADNALASIKSGVFGDGESWIELLEKIKTAAIPRGPGRTEQANTGFEEMLYWFKRKDTLIQVMTD